MDENAWRRVQEILKEALHATGEEREGQLADASPEIRAEVESLLRVHDEAGPVTAPGATAEDEADAPEPGTRIGRYLLLREIGEGGFGVVYLASQIEPYKREVALKVIKIGMDTRQVVARFEAERQALALMDHPGIATVLDGGATESGRPYFVMEYVRGKPITEYCDEHRLDTAERLSLFGMVCQAVQHAHQKGIIHRDIKPSNVLVTEEDGKPVPKIIDFGIAKATDRNLTEQTYFTEMGQIIGTPEYMAPEQAGGAADIDTRADIYALGVLLYEMLTGAPPFDIEELLEQGFMEIIRTIREVDPPKPSTRISTLGDKLPTVAANRHTPPKHLGKIVRGDLDWIVMKALEKDRARRYDSAAALAADVHHYLVDEPVAAGPPSRMYRLKKYVRRHRVGVLAAGTVAAALLVGLALALTGMQEARHQAEIATAEAEKAATTLGLVQEMLSAADPHEVPDPNYTVRQLLGDFESGLGDRLAGQPEVDAAVRATIGATYLGLGLPDQSEEHLEAALRIRQTTLGSEHLDTAESLADWAALLHARGRYALALESGSEALAIRERAWGRKHTVVAENLERVSMFLFGLGRLEEAEEAAREVVEIREELLGPTHRDTALARSTLAAVYKRQGRLADAERLFRTALEDLQKLSPDGHPDVATVLQNLASLLGMKGALQDAIRKFQEAAEMSAKMLGDEHPAVALTQSNLAELLTLRGMARHAEPLLLEALENLEAAYGQVHPQVAMTKRRLAEVYQAQGHNVKAEEYYEQAIKMQKDLLGEDHPIVAQSLLRLGLLHESMSDYQTAEEHYDRALRIFEEALGPRNPFVANTLSLLSNLMREQGVFDKAEDYARDALEMRKETVGEENLLVAGDLATLAFILSARQNLVEARPLFDQAIEMEKAELGDDNPKVLATRNGLGLLLLSNRHYDEAEELFRELVTSAERVFPSGSPAYLKFTANYMHSVAASLMFRHELTEAERLERIAIERMAALPWAPDRWEANLRLTLAKILTLDGRYEDAEDLCVRALAISTTKRGPEQVPTAYAQMRLGEIEFLRETYAEAEANLAAALETARKGVDDASDARLPQFLRHLALARAYLDRGADARALAEEAVDLDTTHRGPEDVETGTSKRYLAEVLSLTGAHDAAARHAREAVEVLVIVLGPDDRQVADARRVLGEVLQRKGDEEGAQAAYEAALATYRTLLRADHPVLTAVEGQLRR